MNDAEQRGIAIATSKPMGRSQVHFPEREVKNRRMVMELDERMETTENQRQQNDGAERSEWPACVCRSLHNHHFFHPVPRKREMKNKIKVALTFWRYERIPGNSCGSMK